MREGQLILISGFVILVVIFTLALFDDKKPLTPQQAATLAHDTCKGHSGVRDFGYGTDGGWVICKDGMIKGFDR